MVAHLDAVTSLSIDPTGLYLLSGSESICFATLHVCLLLGKFHCIYSRPHCFSPCGGFFAYVLLVEA